MSERGNAKLNGAGRFECKVCGVSQAPPRLPVPLATFLDALRAFIDGHAACLPVIVPAFKIGDKVRFDLRNREVRGKVHKHSQPAGVEVLIKYHGGNFVWRKVRYVRPAEMGVPV